MTRLGKPICTMWHRVSLYHGPWKETVGKLQILPDPQPLLLSSSTSNLQNWEKQDSIYYCMQNSLLLQLKSQPKTLARNQYSCLSIHNTHLYCTLLPPPPPHHPVYCTATQEAPLARCSDSIAIQYLLGER